MQALAEKLALPCEEAHVFVCGSSAMVDGVKATFEALGLPEGRVHTNF